MQAMPAINAILNAHQPGDPGTQTNLARVLVHNRIVV